jgi:alginate O-acetyltransferase complex protein AlgI
MAIAGLWHGANFTFILWGTAWGVYILLGRTIAIGPALSRWLWLPHMAVVVLLWVLFRSPSLDYATSYWLVMLGLSQDVLSSTDAGVTALADGASSGLLPVAGIVALLALHRVEGFLEGRHMLATMRRWNGPAARGVLTGLIVLLVLIPSTYGNPFIYFRF